MVFYFLPSLKKLLQTSTAAPFSLQEGDDDNAPTQHLDRGGQSMALRI